MRFRYREFDGQEFAGQEGLARFDQLMEFVLDYGDHALDALKQFEKDPEKSEFLDKLVQDGLLEKAGARWRLTPRAIDAMQRKALMEVFAGLRRGNREGHETRRPGSWVSGRRARRSTSSAIRSASWSSVPRCATP
jgi:Ca-activated chloride channel homolog